MTQNKVNSSRRNSPAHPSPGVQSDCASCTLLGHFEATKMRQSNLIGVMSSVVSASNSGDQPAHPLPGGQSLQVWGPEAGRWACRGREDDQLEHHACRHSTLFWPGTGLLNINNCQARRVFGLVLKLLRSREARFLVQAVKSVLPARKNPGEAGINAAYQYMDTLAKPVSYRDLPRLCQENSLANLRKVIWHLRRRSWARNSMSMCGAQSEPVRRAARQTLTIVAVFTGYV